MVKAKNATQRANNFSFCAKGTDAKTGKMVESLQKIYSSGEATSWRGKVTARLLQSVNQSGELRKTTKTLRQRGR
jgi:hypothetical protein